MNVKEEVLKEFEANRGKLISGSEIAKKLNVSRNAVWKAVKSLQDEGYIINSEVNKGYSLSNENDLLSPQSISSYLNDKTKKLKIEVFKTLESTNTLLKNIAAKGEDEGKVIIAEEQTSGRGRFGRTFYSPANTGIYMSILLKPNFSAQESLYVTTSAAVAVAEAIEKVSGCEAKIKWVNDIYCNDKKVCGILTEASFNIENGMLDYVVLGIGLNVINPKEDFPDDIKNIASSIFNVETYTGGLRIKLVADILNNFWYYYENIKERTFLKKYKKRSLIIGKEINVISSSRSKKAFVLDIDDECRLIVKWEDGSIEAISSGEVSIRKIN
ncbi:MAG: biotin--[acetyl-CoA-carboxylase] ligase [Tissierellia bacterium]|nr:biotin--[acetyl-CoA-carboxylase] ligase [Tissierellia bacterium]